MALPCWLCFKAAIIAITPELVQNIANYSQDLRAPTFNYDTSADTRKQELCDLILKCLF